MKKILVIDDEPDIARVVRFRLIKSGFEVKVAVNGQEGLENVFSWGPDLVLLDLSLPIMNGDEVCKSMKADEKTRSIPVILMTASTKWVTDKSLESIGAQDKLLKPFETEALLEKINKLIK